MSDFKLLIGGRLVAGDLSMPVMNPATDTVLATAPRASEAQLDAAVAAAKDAFPAWSALPLADRRAAILRLADALKQHAAEFARLLTQEQGKPLAESTAEIAYTEAFLRQSAALDLPVRVVEEWRRGEEGGREAVTWGMPFLERAYSLD